jgi:hypothetical protein
VVGRSACSRLEILWGGTEETSSPNHPFTQTWRIYPILWAHPPTWHVITITSEAQKLKTIALEEGCFAQEGTREYLVRSLDLMTQSPDKYTHDVGTAVIEALEQAQVRWLHLH